MSRSMIVAVGQMAGMLLDIDANMREACRLARESADRGARLLLLPEGCLTGNSQSSAAKQATLMPVPESFAPLARTARERNITICAGFVTRFDSKFNVGHTVIRPDGEVLIQRKAAKTPIEPEFLEPWPDPARAVFDVDGVRVVLVICSESGSNAVNERVRAAEPHLVLHPSAGHEPQDKIIHSDWDENSQSAFHERMRAIFERTGGKCAQDGLARIGANPIGFDGEVYWPGNSCIIDRFGHIRAWLPGENVVSRMHPSVAVAELEFAT